MEARIEGRRKDFKKTSEDPRRKREDLTVQIRKADREAQLRNKRTQAMEGACPSVPYAQQSLEPLVAAVNSNDAPAQHEATQQFRKLLSTDKNPPIQEVISCGLVPRFIEFLKLRDRPLLQFEAAWALTNIASGSRDQTETIINEKGVPIFVELLSSPQEDVKEQAVWALGNIAGDCAAFRDIVLEAGALPPLLDILRGHSKFQMLRIATWALSNFCRGSPRPDFAVLSPSLEVLRTLIYSSDMEVLTDACWALSYLSDGPDRHIDQVLASGVCRRLVELLKTPYAVVQTPALRAIGNIVTGNNSQTQQVLACGALSHLLGLLSSNKVNIKKEACWTISNITAGNRTQIQEVIDAGIIPVLVRYGTSGEHEVRKEAVWALCNAVSGGSSEQVDSLVNFGVMKPLCDILEPQSETIVAIALEAILWILNYGQQKVMHTEQENPYIEELDQAKGIAKLETLQQRAPENSRVYALAVDIMTKFLETYDDVLDAPCDETGGTAFAMDDAQGLEDPVFGNSAQDSTATFNFSRQ